MVVGSDDTGARSSNICLSVATGIHPAPMVRPFSRGLWDWVCFIWASMRLRGSILRFWRGRSLGYSDRREPQNIFSK